MQIKYISINANHLDSPQANWKCQEPT